MSLKITIQSSEVIQKAKEKLKRQIEEDLKKVGKTLAASAMKKAEDLGREKLPNSLNDIWQSNLYIEQMSDNITVVGIREPAIWIEEGRKSGTMDELLTQKSGSPVKTSKEGNRYRIIPFEKSTSKPAPESAGENLVGELKKFLKGQGVRYSKTRSLALDESGSPRIGKIHSFNIKEMRDKKKRSVQNLSRNLQGVSIYQNMNPKTGKVERNIMTFRVISDKTKDNWQHPGRDPERILEETFKWVQEAWQKDILPELKNKYGAK